MTSARKSRQQSKGCRNQGAARRHNAESGKLSMESAVLRRQPGRQTSRARSYPSIHSASSRDSLFVSGDSSLSRGSSARFGWNSMCSLSSLGTSPMAEYSTTRGVPWGSLPSLAGAVLAELKRAERRTGVMTGISVSSVSVGLLLPS